MKKSLHLLLAFALVFSMFSSMAFAADQSVADRLVNAGIITGNNSGDLMENEQWKRQDVTVIIARLLGAANEAANTAKNHTFADVTDPFYDGYITYAKELGIFQGHSDVRFGYGEAITVKQFAAVMLRVLGYDPAWDEVEELAVEVGLVPAGTDFEVPATRGEYFTIIDTTLQTETADGEILGVALGLPGYAPEAGTGIASVAVTGAKKLTVTFNGPVDSSKAKFSVKRDGTINVNQDSVEFSSDKTSAVITLSGKIVKGEYTVSVSGVAAEDLSATVATEDEKVADVTLNGDVAAAVVDNNNQITGATISYKAYNQYGEDVTRDAVASNLLWTPSLGGIDNNNTGNGRVTLDNGAGVYFKDTSFSLTVVNQSSALVKTFIIKIGEPSKISTVEVVGLKHPQNKELKQNSNFSEFFLVLRPKDQYGDVIANANRFNAEVLVVTVGSYLNVATANNQPAAIAGDDPGTLKLHLAAPSVPQNQLGLAGKTVVSFIPVSGGSKVEYEVTIGEAQKVASITISKPESVVAAGDTNVEIPYVAYDQFGQEITDASVLSSVTLTPNGRLQFEQDYVTGKAVLKYTAPNAAGLDVLMAVAPSATTTSQITLDVKAAREAKVVNSVKDLKTAFALDGNNGGKTTFRGSDIVIQDQYGKEFRLPVDNNGDYNGYRIVVSASDNNLDKVKLDGNTQAVNITKPTQVVEIEGAAAGTERLKFVLQKNDNGWQNVTGSELELTLRVVAKSDISSYDASDIPTLYNEDSDRVAANQGKQQPGHSKTLDVYGLLGDGTKVVLPDSMYSVTTSVYGVVFNTNDKKLTATNDVNFTDNNQERSGFVFISINDAGDGTTIQKEVKVSNASPAINAIALRPADQVQNVSIRSGAIVGTTQTVTVANIINALKVTDQYGADISIGNPLVTFTGAKFATRAQNEQAATLTNGYYNLQNGPVIQNLKAGDSFNFNVYTSNGKTFTVRVVVE